MLDKPSFIWFVGPSGSGKTTAVTECFTNNAHPLRERLGLTGGEVTLCSESLCLEHREELLKCLVSTYCDFSERTAVLIDGQWPEVRAEMNDTIRRLRNEKPDAAHRIVWLNCSPEIAAIRVRQRNRLGWEATYSEEMAKNHHETMFRDVIALVRDGFEVTVIDSSDLEYRISDWASAERHCPARSI